MRSILAAGVVALTLFTSVGAARAQAPAAAPPAPDPTVDPEQEVTAEVKEEARKHFQKGIGLLRERAWAPALAEFLLSRKLYATRVATNNAAIALRELQRYDEALDMFETLLREFRTVPEDERATVQRHIAELRALVGTVEVRGAEPGASIVVSSVERGQYPPIDPIRVAAGTHVVRLYKEGFEPFETRVNVAGGQTVFVDAKLARLTASGKLRVTERSGRAVDVLVDNVTVGRTPWEGRIGVGDHVVALRGDGKVGSQPSAAKIQSEQLTSLALTAEDLDASLRVEPRPPGASVWIDGVNVGRGTWLGRLRVGKHEIELNADGFLSQTRSVELGKGQRESLALELERDEEAPVWRKPSRWTVDAGAHVVLAPSFGGDIAAACSGDCSQSLGLGALALAHGSYELGSGLGFGLEAGYLFAVQDVTGREAQIQPVGFAAPSTGTADDALRLSGFMGGATIGYHFTDISGSSPDGSSRGSFPLVVRLGAGALVGELRDERNASFTDQSGASYMTTPVADLPGATYFYLDPSVRAGVRFAEQWELTGSVQALVLFALSTPTWNDRLELGAAADGIGTYPEEELMGTIVLMVSPGLNLRYDWQ